MVAIKNLGRNKISIDFTAANNANNYKTEDFKKRTYCIHSTFSNCTYGRSKGYTHWSLEELEGIHTPINCGEIIGTRRLNVKFRKADFHSMDFS